MEQKNLSKIFWTEALTGGLIVGIGLFVWELIGYWLNLPEKHSGVVSFVQFVILIAGIIYFCRRLRDFRGQAIGFPYTVVFGFILSMMLFTGIVYGAGQFFLQAVIAPAYYDGIFEATIVNSSFDENLTELMLSMRPMMKNPFIMILSGIFSFVIYGGLIGLLAAAFLQRPPAPRNHLNPEM